MTTSTKKRYLVTHATGNVGLAKAESRLAFAAGTLADGCAFMAGSNTPGEDDHLHFDHIGCSSVCLTQIQAQALMVRPGIVAIEEDSEMHILGFPVDDLAPAVASINSAMAGPKILWNMQNIKAPDAWARNIKGTGVKLAILDTGIAAHPDLIIAGGISFVDGVTSYNDGNGHGTHCSGIATGQGVLAPNGYNVFGVAPGCSLWAVKVLSDAGSGMMSWILAGMNWCAQNGVKVASMSLGSQSAPSIAYATAIKRCQDNGVTVVCASGNAFQSAFPWVGSPANSFDANDPNASAIAVGAVDQANLIARFSSRGGQTSAWNQVGVVAPGVDIYSTYLNDGYATLSGTSMACPHVAGLAALMNQRLPTLSSQRILSIMRTTALHLGTPTPNITYGSGLINCDGATR